MPITADDLMFFAAVKATDDDDAGGVRSGTVATNGALGVFPPVTDTDALAGSTRMRKLYPSVVSDDASALLAATVCVDQVPASALIEAALLAYGDDATTRAQFEANGLPKVTALQTIHSSFNGVGTTEWWSRSGTFDGGTNTITLDYSAPLLPVGSVVGVEVVPASGVVSTVTRATSGGGNQTWEIISTPAGRATLHYVTASDGSTLTVSPPLPGVAVGTACIVRRPTFTGRAWGSVSLSAQALTGATSLAVADWTAGLVPVGTSYPSADLGITPTGMAAIGGRAPCVASGDIATLWHEDETAPQAIVNGSVINVGRTNLQQAALVDSAGVELGRFIVNGPAVVGNFTSDLAAGTLTISDVTGISQPVSVRHRIAERVSVDTVQGATVAIAAGLSRDFPADSMLSTELPLGDLQAGYGTVFSQQAWTKTWSDTVIGTPVPALYAGDIPIANDGAVADRWAAVFTSGTQYTLYSERNGLVGNGNIGTDYSPLNPTTNQPFLTLLAAGWVPGAIALGYTLRFNTRGAYGRPWLIRCAHPGAATGADEIRLRMRGSTSA